MVNSKINRSFYYEESRKIEKNDLSKEVNLYELSIENSRITRMNIVIAIGSLNRKYEDEGLLYFPIYLITKNKKAIQIGLYEIISSDIWRYVKKEDDSFEIENTDLFNRPLLWSWVNDDFLKENRLSPLVIEDEEKEEEDVVVVMEKEEEKEEEIIIPDYRADIFILQKDVIIPKMLKEERKEDADLLRKENDLNWISQFMKNENYKIIEIFKNNDALFSAIKLAFSQLGQQTFEKKLRIKLSESKLIENLFTKNKLNYESFKEKLLNLKKEKERKNLLEEKYKKEYKERIAQNDKENAYKIREEYIKLKDEFKRDKKEEKIISQLVNEYSYMKDINNIEEMKEYIKTNYPGDNYTLLLLEKLLKIKFIVFLKDANTENDMRSVVDCGEKDDEIIGDFNPDYYIFLEYSEEDKRYNLISYKNKFIFKFKEIPYDLKTIVSDKCIENIEGNFSKIADFRRFHKGEEKEFPSNEKIEIEEISISGIMRRYDGVKIIIYCPSSSTKFPGKIKGEIMPDDQKLSYIKLGNFDNWRCILDNNWTGTDIDMNGMPKQYQFELNSFYWNSVQHYIQANKFKEEHPKYYELFALGPIGEDKELYKSSELSKNVELAIFIGTKKAGKPFPGTKDGEFKGFTRNESIQIDKIYSEEIYSKNLKDALYAKFSQNPHFKEILLSTNNSRLVYSSSKHGETDSEELMSVRDILREK